MKAFRRYGSLSFLSLLGALLLCMATATPSQAHWADMAAAEIVVDKTEAQMTLTFPTGLTPFADDNQDGQLSPNEISAHAVELQNFLGQKIQFTDSGNQSGSLVVQPLDQTNLPPTVQAAPNTHSSLMLIYSWLKPVQGLRIHYNLFLPGVSTANCLATILQAGQLKTFVFTPKTQFTALVPGFAAGGLLLAIAGSFAWGAIHSLSPGHGKTIVGAYLVGSRSTPQHALFLAMTTTITHTIGVFALGLVTLFAAQYILPEQLSPWLSLLSGLMVVSIGLNLFMGRLGKNRLFMKLPFKHQGKDAQAKGSHFHSQDREDHHTHLHPHPKATHEHPVPALVYSYSQNHKGADENLHTHDHADPHEHPHLHNHSHEPAPRSVMHGHSHGHDHSHGHSHDGHSHSGHSHSGHSHLPPGANGDSVTWRSLLVMGISGGLVPCPAALVLLLSTVALGNVGLGLMLVLAFSLGLAGVLTGLGLMLVYAKHLFKGHLFKGVPFHPRLMRVLPAVSALGITLLGFGISTRALLQVMS